MKFPDENLLLSSSLAERLYREHAKDLPIIDYHSHLSPKEIVTDKRFENLTELWLAGDHYKWRLMRACGVPERLITGDADPKDKFRAFASCLSLAAGNPIYIWCHLELARYFGIDRPLDAESADGIYEETAARMAAERFSAQRFIRESNVRVVCTTDDPADDLAFHRAHESAAKERGDGAHAFLMRPTFRPDRALNVDGAGYADHVRALTGSDRPSVGDLLGALEDRLGYFAENGCFISDHALGDYAYADCTEREADAVMQKALGGAVPTAIEAEKYRTFVLLFLAREYAKRNIAMQLHVCCRRNNCSAAFRSLGPDSGFDAAARSKAPEKLAMFLDRLAADGALPRTIVYSLDPADDKLLDTILGCFQGEGARGKMQHGCAWWFHDTESGIRRHLRTLSEYSVLGNFIGMLTDSRSFTSYVRHDYFRRILCDCLASLALSGSFPSDMKALGRIAENVAYRNAEEYFGLRAVLS